MTSRGSPAKCDRAFSGAHCALPPIVISLFRDTRDLRDTRDAPLPLELPLNAAEHLTGPIAIPYPILSCITLKSSRVLANTV